MVSTDEDCATVSEYFRSPDLNPIEHLWVELDRRLRSREMRPTSIGQLSAMLQEEWRRIPVDILHKLVESMPDGVAAVVATRGEIDGVGVCDIPLFKYARLTSCDVERSFSQYKSLFRVLGNFRCWIPDSFHRHYGDTVMNERNVRKWCEMFNNGRTNVHDETRPGRPSLITEELKTKVNDRILQDRRTSLDELHIAFPDISRSLLGEIVSQHLGYHKICARPHTAASTRELLDQFGWEIFDHPPYSPDLAPSDFHLFTKLKDFLGGTRFGSDEELKKTVNTWLNELAAEEYNMGILKLVNRYDKCLNVGGDYVEK
ncbi:hypothetical protein ANN_07021 [Periplaneta americana]|uniref:Histone-lysine N-methyltransferase SETMAR n=1 Tax=Periplaneta americana TaxID=6978 RepID=A0ABQ8THB3_PERAM|nr:hypothetical protein ANN_07021 [Periplaneta americana]